MRKASLYIILASLMISLSSSLVHMAGDLPTMQKLFIRSAVMLCYFSGSLFKERKEIKIKKDFMLPVILRGMTGALAVFCSFYAVDHMSVGDANMLSKLQPFFTVIFAGIFLKEKVRRSEAIAIMIAFIGVLFIVQPGMRGAIPPVPALIGATAGIAGGAAFTCVRAANKKGAPKPLIVMSFALGALLLSAPSTLLHFVPMTSRQWLVMAACSAAAIMGHRSNTLAYAYAPPSRISVFENTQVVFAATFGFLMFGQELDVFSIIGYFIIIGVSLIIFMENSRRSHHQRIEERFIQKNRQRQSK